jgi:two-component system CheB/CheR fusion protein
MRSMKKKTLRTKTSKRAPAAKKSRDSALVFPIVGIGASAGGLEAVTQLLLHLPQDIGMAFVLVQHLDPKHESALTALLSRVTPMPVSEAEDGTLVQPGHVYVIPPNKKMGIDNRTLRLLPRGNGSDLHAPVDYFYRSLAADQSGQAIGIVLSGTGSDGTQGLEEIKAAGGITFVQSEDSARYTGMPASAGGSGCADYILPPEKIAKELIRIGLHPQLIPALVTEEEKLLPMDGDEFKQICALLHGHSGVDFSHYKPATLRRRISRRMVLQKLETLKEYTQFLREHQAEVEALFQDILICVTGFFRDAKMFEVLKKKIFPKILKSRQSNAPIRLWVAGCSTGEEAYSLVIALVEFLEKEGARCPIQLFGTDINESVINRARAGIYPEHIKDDVSAERLRKFFTKSDGGYRINKFIRDQCMFARQNVIEDPPFSHVDIITCRNVLIYFDAALQKKVMPVFHYALKPNGYLVLGTAESIGGFVDLFAVADAKFRIYEKKFSHTRHSSVPARFTAVMERRNTVQTGVTRVSVEPVLGDIRKQADAVVLSQFAPAGVVVNSSMDILQFRGRTGPFLENSPGEASLNLLKMARQGLAVELRPLIVKATKQKRHAEKSGIQVRHEGRLLTVTAKAIPLLMPNFSEPFFLVLFEEESAVSAPASKKGITVRSNTAQREMEQLRDELDATKLSLQNIIEEQDASNEELRAANEEILSSNEELQSTNEEMETATEELQSTNEELITVNDELQSRNVELQELSDDMGNLFSSVDIPILMLSHDLCIRRFTPRAVKVLNLIAADIGRPISDFKIKLNLPNLQELITEVLETLNVKELDVQDLDSRWYSLRIRPYKTADNRINGVVLTLQDIDTLKRTLAEVEAARIYAEAIVSTVREPLLILGSDLRVKTANQSFYSLFRTKPDLVQGQFIYDVGDRAWDIPQLRELLEKILPEKSSFQDFSIEHDFPFIGPRSMRLNARRLTTEAGQTPLILLALEDVTGKTKSP